MVLEVALDARIEHVLQEYVVEMLAEFQQCDAERGGDRYRSWLLGSLGRIQKRLGSQRYRELAEQMNCAVDIQLATGDLDLHRRWIETLLVDYYDPMYEYQLRQSVTRVIFRGDARAVGEWAAQRAAQK